MTADQQKEVETLRDKLRKWMVQVKEESALDAFDKRYQPDVLEDLVQSYREQAEKVVEELKTYENAKGYRF